MKTRKIIGYLILASVFIGIYAALAFVVDPLIALIPFAIIGLVRLGTELTT